jgi:hypothetical protein
MGLGISGFDENNIDPRRKGRAVTALGTWNEDMLVEHWTMNQSLTNIDNVMVK